MTFSRHAMLTLQASLLAASIGACQSSTSIETPDARLSHEAAAILEDYALPGMTVAIASPDGVATVASGLANRETNEPMSPNTTMLAASIGKTFVAATLLQLADEGRVGLDDPIQAWLGDRDWFQRLPNGERTTIRHLLQHRSGLPDHIHLESFAALWLNQADTISPEVLIALAFDTEALFAPGESWAYTDTGYLLLGLIIEKASGRPYEESVDERFIAPLGLIDTGPSDRRRLPRLARGYVSSESALGLPEVTTDEDGAMVWNPAIEWTGGGLFSTSRDLAIWGRAFLSGDLVSGTLYSAATSGLPASETDPLSLYGLGIAIRADSEFGPVYGHRGWIPGYVSSLQYYPVYDVAIAFQINTDIGIADVERPVILEIERRLARVLLAGRGDDS
ncbi:serine hydrolase domain-containing protein [Hyphobacterium sp.]|jgi:D-alanyl-D-alanine carboxypeptidase|uniref:serine hydrolase domain-containing protein n=1 Tax=Hyphobacterium sp. TaxID=2004662 RepID=UPI003BAA9BBD